jgi:dephospho-CoA kinase
MIIGITGRIASGKNEVSTILCDEFSYNVIDVDLIGHKLLKDKFTKDKIIKIFGNKVLHENDINRKQLANIVFSDKKHLKKLNEIMHPEILKTVNKITNQKNNVIINAAILCEIGLDQLCSNIIVVDSTDDSVIKRLHNKGFNKKDALVRIESQKTREEYNKLGYVITNNSDLKTLKQQTIEIFRKLSL